MLLLLSSFGASSTIKTILLDASNLQLSLRDGLSTPNLYSHDLPALAPKLDRVARYLSAPRERLELYAMRVATSLVVCGCTHVSS